MSASPLPPASIRFGCFDIDLESGELRKRGVRIRLQEQPFQVLLALLERPGHIVTREELRQKIWHDHSFVDFDQGLNRAINKIREALGDSAENPRFIETLPKRGYRFIATGEAVDSAVRRIDSLAVLPFARSVQHAAAEGLCEAITSSLIEQLSQFANLRVISHYSVERYRGDPRDLQAVGREMGVQAVLVGRLVQRTDNLEIRLELVDTRDNRHLWGASYEGKLADIVKTREHVVEHLLKNVSTGLTGEQSRLVQAHQLYLKGRHYLSKLTTDSMNISIQYFQEAIEKNHNHALAYVALADSYNMLARYGTMSPRQAHAKAKAAAQKALSLKPDLAEAHTSLAFVRHRFEWDWHGAEDEFRRAIELQPTYAPAHQWYASFLAAMSRVDESITEAQHACRLDPTSVIANARLGWVLYLAGRPGQAIAQCERALELDPTFFQPRRYLGLAYTRKGLHEKAVSELEQATALSGGRPSGKAALAYAYAKAARTAEARQALKELLERSELQASPYDVAIIHQSLGSTEEGFRWLEKALQNRATDVVYLNVDPRFDDLRPHPRFQDLTRRLNFPGLEDRFTMLH